MGESEETLVEVGIKQVVEEDDIQVVEEVKSEKPTTSTPLRTSPRKKVSNTKQVVEDDDIQVVEEVKSEKSTTSTPLRTSPRKKVSNTNTPTSASFTPDPDRAKKLSIAKLKVKISELNMTMDKAVEDMDFLKAHESKQAIQKLEEEIKDIDADTSYVSQSFSNLSGVDTSTEITPKVNLKATPKNSKNVSVVSTPGSTKVTPTLFKKLTPGQLAKQEELKKKREALEKEKQAKKETLEKEKQAKKDALGKARSRKGKVKTREGRGKTEKKSRERG